MLPLTIIQNTFHKFIIVQLRSVVGDPVNPNRLDGAQQFLKLPSGIIHLVAQSKISHEKIGKVLGNRIRSLVEKGCRPA
jgi:hypothetical protein